MPSSANAVRRIAFSIIEVDGLLDGLLQARAQREAPGGCELPAGPEPRGTGAGDRGQDHPGVRHGARLRAVRTECGRIS
jgi:hypothetical protein